MKMTNTKLVAVCRPTHEPLVRDCKWIATYQSLGYETIFVGNRRESVRSSSEHSCEYRFAGFAFPYSSWRVPIGNLGYALSLLDYLRDLSPTLIHAGDVEGLLGAALYKTFFCRKCRIIYDVADNFSARYTLPRWLATAIQVSDDVLASLCDCIIVPQENRLSNFKLGFRVPVEIVPNCPMLKDAPPPRLLPVGPARILLSGWLTWTRGIRQLVTAASMAGNVELIAVGLFGEGVKKFLEDSGVVQVHQEWCSQAQVLKMAGECQLVAAFYEPSARINRQAASNKVFDAMAAARPVLINSEVEEAKRVVEDWQCGFSVPYHDVPSLTALFRQLGQRRDETTHCGINGRMLFEKMFHWEKVSVQITRKL